ncbi:MAG: hypothetical protein GOP50_12165 [Candidatus Heimdallarchaeota archaeon]|nr:hypothetical protein [Candidatus Heimdallarchaeota archaeon]
MKPALKYLTGIAVGIIVLASVFVPLSLLVWNNRLVQHDPILIWKDEDFTGYNLPGKGTLENPYRIENYNITTDDLYCIYIINTTKYFLIENCYLQTTHEEGYGIYLSDTTSGTGKITKTTIDKCDTALGLFESSGNDVIDNSISLCKTPFDIYKSNSTDLINNSLSNYEEASNWNSYIYSSYDTNFIGNVVLKYDYGLFFAIEDSDDISFAQNDLQDVTLYIQFCSNITIMKNQGSECHINLGNSQNNTINDNQIHSLDIYNSFYTEVRNNYLIRFDIYLESSSDIYFYTFEDNYVNDKKLEFFIGISSLSITTSLSEYGRIYFLGCTDITISDPTPMGGYLPIDFVDCMNIFISNVNQDLDLSFQNSDNCMLTETNILDLELFNSEDITVSDCNVNGYEIDVLYSNNIAITDNQISISYLRIDHDNGVNLINNEISVEEIDISYVQNLIMQDNNISDCLDGLRFYMISDSMIMGNLIKDMTEYGIAFSDFHNISFENNLITDCLKGLNLFAKNLDQYLLSSFSDNYFDGKIIGYYASVENLIIDTGDFAQMIFVNCTNLLIKDIIVTNSPDYIRIVYSDKVIVSNVTCEDSFGGISVHYTENLEISICSFNSITYTSIDFGDCPSASIVNNTINSSGVAVNMYLSDYTQILNNSIENTQNGVIVFKSLNCSINWNSMINCSEVGIELYRSDYCNITYNLLKDCYYWGVKLQEESTYNQIHHNAFINNNWQTINPEYTSQAIDDGQNNIWFYPILLEGNYFDDWSGSGEYVIYGEALNTDPYPLITNPL